jgi:FkbM family methyltransferase
LPLLAARSRLPFKLWLASRYGGAEAELVHLDRIANRRGSAIDAGANIGLYSLRMSRLFKKVYSFEINPEISRDLKDCRLPNVEIFDVGLSDRTGEATLYTPVLESGMRLDGWASLQSGECPEAKQYLERSVTLKPLDEFNIDDCSFIKIDVEGHELRLLEGAVETIKRGRPVILVEIRERNEASVFSLLESLGYRRGDLKELAGIPASPGNFIFVPQ